MTMIDIHSRLGSSRSRRIFANLSLTDVFASWGGSARQLWGSLAGALRATSHDVMQIVAAALITTCWLQPVAAGQTTKAADAEAAARANWRAFIARTPTPTKGCFRASYPNLVWEETECIEVPLRVHPHPKIKSAATGNTVGNGNDYVAESAGLINSTFGTFPVVTGVENEEGVGVAAFGGGGILGPNEYSLQLNSNANGTTAACAGHAGCTVWQQFIYATDYSSPGQATVFMQYWLLNYGNSCPSGWGGYMGSCYTNSSGMTAPDMEITALGSLSVYAAAASGGNDRVVFNNGSTSYAVSAPDSVLDLSQVWNQSEFNIVGDAGGSEAVFNSGVSVTVNIALTDGSTAAPSCVVFAGSTGETNNLTLGPNCNTAGGAAPSIQFDEGNLAPTITSANATTVTGTSGTFQVTASGDPNNTFGLFGEPSFVSIGPFSGLMSITPTAGEGGVYPAFTITASNGVGTATQTFTLTVDEAPIITSANNATFTVGELGSVQVTATGFPPPTFTYTGALPSGVTLSPTGTLSGVPGLGTAGVYNIVIIASNGISPVSEQNFKLTVVKAATSCSIYSSSQGFVNGKSVIFTTYVTTAANEVIAPTGTVTFYDQANSLITLATVPLINGVATLHAALHAPPDTQAIWGVFSGDHSFKGCTTPHIIEEHE